MAERLTCAELLGANEIASDAIIEGAELVQLFWTLRGRAQESGRKDRYWASVSDALKHAYEELENKTAQLDRAREELVRTNHQLEGRVATQLEEILQRASEVEALNVQLHAKVRSRARALLRALRETRPGEDAAFLPEGSVIGGRARVRRNLGEGGMGAVYLADDLLVSRPVTLKILRATGRRALEHFIAEAEAANAVPHAAIVKTLHVDITPEGHVYQLREFVDGVTLARFIRAGPVAATAMARLGGSIADALAAAHACGVVHRDVKPANVMLSRAPPFVRLLDFGIAKRMDDDPGLALTRTQARIGTPAYMSPEQVSSPAAVTPATDVYSLGVSIFEAITARRPFESTSADAVLLAHLVEPPPDLRDVATSVPDALADLVAACLRKAPSERPKADELARGLFALADELGGPSVETIAASAQTAGADDDGTRTGS